MICISCGSTLRVINSRPQTSRNGVWRRRRCERCDVLYTTTEHIDLSQVLHVNKAGQLSPFNPDKLFISLYNSCRHRPTASQDARGLSDTVTNRLVKAATGGRIEASDITLIATGVLKRFDRAAAVQYTAFHK